MDNPENPKKRILVAEDNPVNRRIIDLILRPTDYDYKMVENGAEAVSAVTQRDYDLILMDIMMPVMDGLTATREIRRLGSQVKIIAVTANIVPADQQKCFDAGMNAYLPKPVTREKLLNAIDGIFMPTENGDDSVLDLAELRETLQDDPDLISLVLNEFLDSITKQLRYLKVALAENDVNLSDRVAHTIKGSASQLGAEGLRELAYKIELSAKQSDLESAHDLLNKLEYQWQLVEREIRSRFSK